MFVILVYDVNVKRVSKIHKTCRKYLKRVQRSVFEGELSQKQLTKLQNELERLVRPSEDAVYIYLFESMRYAHKISLGAIENHSNIL